MMEKLAKDDDALIGLIIAFILILLIVTWIVSIIWGLIAFAGVAFLLAGLSINRKTPFLQNGDLH